MPWLKTVETVHLSELSYVSPGLETRRLLGLPYVHQVTRLAIA